MTPTALGGTFAMAEGLHVTRMGYGAMQLAGPGRLWSSTRPRRSAGRLRAVVELGITHIDTSDYYGPFVTNALIKEALYPYPDDLVIVTKVGARRDDTGNWLHARTPEEIRSAVHDNLDHLGLDTLDSRQPALWRLHRGPNRSHSKHSLSHWPNSSNRD